jgi:hypothetical protein
MCGRKCRAPSECFDRNHCLLTGFAPHGGTPLKQGNQTVRLRPKWTVSLWVASVGVAMAAWLAGLGMAGIWLVELALP